MGNGDGEAAYMISEATSPAFVGQGIGRNEAVATIDTGPVGFNDLKYSVEMQAASIY